MTAAACLRVILGEHIANDLQSVSRLAIEFGLVCKAWREVAIRDVRSMVILQSAADVQTRYAEIQAKLGYLEHLVQSLVICGWPGSTAHDPDSPEIGAHVAQMTNLRTLTISNRQINRRPCAAIGNQRLHTLQILLPWPILGAAAGLLLPLHAPAVTTLASDELPTYFVLPIG